MFINFSNHPSDRWDEDQRQAALEYGDIVDIAFPNVPADADETEVSQLADICVKQILSATEDKDNDAVMAQGEFTLTYKVICVLKQNGIKVVSACTRRNAVERIDENGRQVKESRFEFVRFRRY